MLSSLKNGQDPWSLILKGVHAVLIGIMPLAASLVVLFYFSLIHELLRSSSLEPGILAFLILVPPVFFEVWFTRIFETKRYNWNLIVILGLAGRLVFISWCFYLFIWSTLLFKNTPDAFVGLLRKWPSVVIMVWAASPKLTAIIGALAVGIYLVLTCNYRLLRLQTTVVIPAAATYLLFQLFYFYPTSPLRLESNRRPQFVQKVFPTEEFFGSQSVFSPPLFAREMYVDPADQFAVMTFGASYGSEHLSKPNFVWLDLNGKRYGYERMDQVRYFYSECPEAIYAAPFHGSKFYGFDPYTKKIQEHSLPKRIQGFDISEILFTYHDCDSSTVYLANNRNPVLLAWDTQLQSLKQAIPLVDNKLLDYGDIFGRILNNRANRRIYLLSVGRHELIEMHEDSLRPSRVINLPADPFDMRESSDGKKLYIQAFFLGKIWKLNSESLAIESTLDSLAGCRRIGLSVDDRLLFAASYLSGEAAVIDPDRGDRLLEFFVTPKLEGMHVTGRYLYLLGAEGLFRVVLSDLEDLIK